MLILPRYETLKAHFSFVLVEILISSPQSISFQGVFNRQYEDMIARPSQDFLALCIDQVSNYNCGLTGLSGGVGVAKMSMMSDKASSNPVLCMYTCTLAFGLRFRPFQFHLWLLDKILTISLPQMTITNPLMMVKNSYCAGFCFFSEHSTSNRFGSLLERLLLCGL